MLVSFLQKVPVELWLEKIPKGLQYPRHFKTKVDLSIELSDGYILKIPKDFIWDGASVPECLFWLFPPVDEGAMGDLIHDMLWIDKQGQFEHFNFNIYVARKFADDERLKWRKKLAPKRKIFNWVSHNIIRLVGGFYYSHQLNIPK